MRIRTLIVGALFGVTSLAAADAVDPVSHALTVLDAHCAELDPPTGYDFAERFARGAVYVGLSVAGGSVLAAKLARGRAEGVATIAPFVGGAGLGAIIWGGLIAGVSRPLEWMFDAKDPARRALIEFLNMNADERRARLNSDPELGEALVEIARGLTAADEVIERTFGRDAGARRPN